MSRRNEPERAAPTAIYLIAALLAAIAGFGLVYVSFDPSDNGRSEATRPATPARDAPAATGESGAAPLGSLSKGAMAPLVIRRKPLDLADFTFSAGGGATKSLKDFAGTVVLLNIWATWCVPCREEMPALDALEAKLGGKDFAVVAVNIDKGGPEKAAGFFAVPRSSGFGVGRDPGRDEGRVLLAGGQVAAVWAPRRGVEVRQAGVGAVAPAEAAVAALGIGVPVAVVGAAVVRGRVEERARPVLAVGVGLGSARLRSRSRCRG